MNNVNSTQLLFELSKPGCRAVRIRRATWPVNHWRNLLPAGAMSDTPLPLPELSETGKSCDTSSISRPKHVGRCELLSAGLLYHEVQPKRNERLAALPGLADLHPYQPRNRRLQGMLFLLHQAQHMLAEIAGLPAVSLQPAAGAHGEMAALLVAAAYFRDRQEKRSVVLIPDAAHGTNPASAAKAGFEIMSVKSTPKGFVDLDDLAAKLQRTNGRVHDYQSQHAGTVRARDRADRQNGPRRRRAGVLDGANMNAILGIARPGEFGVDLMHFNPHKTFSGPHGGGGPGAGPIAVAEKLAPFLRCPWWSKMDAATT